MLGNMPKSLGLICTAKQMLTSKAKLLLKDTIRWPLDNKTIPTAIPILIPI